MAEPHVALHWMADDIKKKQKTTNKKRHAHYCYRCVAAVVRIRDLGAEGAEAKPTVHFGSESVVQNRPSPPSTLFNLQPPIKTPKPQQWKKRKVLVKNGIEFWRCRREDKIGTRIALELSVVAACHKYDGFVPSQSDGTPHWAIKEEGIPIHPAQAERHIHWPILLRDQPRRVVDYVYLMYATTGMKTPLRLVNQCMDASDIFFDSFTYIV